MFYNLNYIYYLCNQIENIQIYLEKKMEKKRMYVAPEVKVTHVILESGVTVDCSPIDPKGIDVYDWELGEEQGANQGDIWIPI